MAQKKKQYVLVPAAGLTASEANPKQMQFFQTLHATSLAVNKVHSVSSELGALPVKVLDSIGETKPKLIEAAPEDLAALQSEPPFGAHPAGGLFPACRDAIRDRPPDRVGRRESQDSRQGGRRDLDHHHLLEGRRAGCRCHGRRLHQLCAARRCAGNHQRARSREPQPRWQQQEDRAPLRVSRRPPSGRDCSAI